MSNPTANSGSALSVRTLFLMRVQERTLEVCSDEALLQTLKAHTSDGWRLVAMDDVSVDGLCEGCGLPIIGGTTAWGPDEYGVILCAKCAEGM